MNDGYLRIGEFSERVGVSPDRLRAWERRYALLGPDRSAGGFRLYSDEDVARVRRMVDLIEEGLSASEAARLAATGAALGDASVSANRSAQIDGSSVAALRTALAGALDQFDESGAHRALDQMLATFDADTVLREVLLPYLADLGERWAAGSITVGQEHFASNLLRGRLLGLARGWGLGTGPHALLAAPEGEEHDLALIAFGLALWRRGWRVTFLGADTPAVTLREAAARLEPDLVVVSAVAAAPLEAAAAELGSLATRVAIAGAGATDVLAAAIGADHLDTDPVAAADRVAGTPLRRR